MTDRTTTNDVADQRLEGTKKQKKSKRHGFDLSKKEPNYDEAKTRERENQMTLALEVLMTRHQRWRSACTDCKTPPHRPHVALPQLILSVVSFQIRHKKRRTLRFQEIRTQRQCSH